MKKVFFILMLFVGISSCDDGDVAVEAFDFENAPTLECGENTDDFFIYKISGNEVLIIELSEDFFPNQITLPNQPRLVQIPTVAKVTYRLYNGSVAATTLCSVVPPAQPQVLEEWTATGGTLEITTGVVNTTDENGANPITAYNHNLIFRDIVFNRPDGTVQRNETLVFGSYRRANLNAPVNFGAINGIQSCNNNSLLYKSSGAQLLLLSLSNETFNSLFIDEATTTGNPRTALLNDQDRVFFNVYQSPIAQASICAGTLPTISQTFGSVAGVAGQSGIISVETTETAGIFSHQITFRRVILRETGQNLSFTFGDNYDFGVYLPN